MHRVTPWLKAGIKKSPALEGSCQVQSEQSLIRRAQQRDQVALTQLYEENFDRIYRYIVFKIGDRTEAEDMTQQVFLNAIQSISSYNCKGMPFSSWLYRIAHNQVVDHLRRKSRRITVPLDESISANEDDPKHVAEQKIEIEEVVAAVKGLTRAQQEVISLRFAGQLSVMEVAKAMGKSEGAVKAMQHGAIAALRKALGKVGVA
jgi:RNA polymerase sigma-70 factor (ECF subfamily)